MTPEQLKKFNESFEKGLQANGLIVVHAKYTIPLQRHAIAMSIVEGSNGENNIEPVIKSAVQTLNAKRTRRAVNPSVTLSEDGKNLIYVVHSE